MTAGTLDSGNLSDRALQWVRAVRDQHREDGRPVAPERVPELLRIAGLWDQARQARGQVETRRAEIEQGRVNAGGVASVRRHLADAERRARELDRDVNRALRAWSRGR